MTIIIFLVCLIASTVGAVVGFGGGVVIKPALDALNFLPVSTISFLSGATVLAMSVSSLIRNRNDGVKLKVRTSTPLAIGAVIGGISGKYLFEIVRNSFSNESVLGLIQAICILIMTVSVLIYVIRKGKIKSKHVNNLIVCLLIGAILGIMSSFLGIGGGPANLAILFYLFSMDAKEAAKNSIYIIMFSQIASIANAVIQNTVPSFEWQHLILMSIGGIAGAIVGSEISKRIDNKHVEKMLVKFMLVIILINIYNIVVFITKI